MKMINGRREKTRGGLGIGQATADQQARQRLSGIGALGTVCISTAVKGKLRKIAKSGGEYLHLRWICRSQFPAGVSSHG
jgi:hypothetical protein